MMHTILQFTVEKPGKVIAYGLTVLFLFWPFSDGSVNVALDKDAFQISTWSNRRAYLAVDGTLDGTSCTYTEFDISNPWWVVALGKQITVAYVKIVGNSAYTVSAELLHDFTIAVSFEEPPAEFASLNLTAHPVCAQFNGTMSKSRYGVTLNCEPVPLRGKYVYVYMEGDSETLSLCEVEVYECDHGKYGANCLGTCGSCANNGDCDKVNGTCLIGCADGWKGDTCQKECDPGEYGPGCTLRCGQCRNQKVCDGVDGFCPDGCSEGWIGDTCNTVICDDGQYGAECKDICGNCYNGTACDKSDGQCPAGCAGGYRGTLCKAECQDYQYGANCPGVCGRCKGGVPCNKVNGHCPDGCDAGWQGALCNECTAGRYGAGCTQTCGHCAGKTVCNNVDGHCPAGCETGWKGDLCKDAEYGTTTEPSSAAVVVPMVITMVTAMMTTGHCWSAL